MEVSVFCETRIGYVVCADDFQAVAGPFADTQAGVERRRRISSSAGRAHGELNALIQTLNVEVARLS